MLLHFHPYRHSYNQSPSSNIAHPLRSPYRWWCPLAWLENACFPQLGLHGLARSPGPSYVISQMGWPLRFRPSYLANLVRFTSPPEVYLFLSPTLPGRFQLGEVSCGSKNTKRNPLIGFDDTLIKYTVEGIKKNWWLRASKLWRCVIGFRLADSQSYSRFFARILWCFRGFSSTICNHRYGST